MRCKKIKRIRRQFGKQTVQAVRASKEDRPLPGGGWAPGPEGCLDSTAGKCGTRKAWIIRASKELT